MSRALQNKARVDFVSIALFFYKLSRAPWDLASHLVTWSDKVNHVKHVKQVFWNKVNHVKHVKQVH